MQSWLKEREDEKIALKSNLELLIECDTGKFNVISGKIVTSSKMYRNLTESH